MLVTHQSCGFISEGDCGVRSCCKPVHPGCKHRERSGSVSDTAKDGCGEGSILTSTTSPPTTITNPVIQFTYLARV